MFVTINFGSLGIPARRDRIVERVELASVAEKLRQPPEVEQILMAETADLLEYRCELLVGASGDVVVDERSLLGRAANHRLLKMHFDQSALVA